jgi:hypothetical protein
MPIVIDNEPDEIPLGPDFDRRLRQDVLRLGGRELFVKSFHEDPAPDLVAEVEQAKAAEFQPAHTSPA